MTTVKRKDRMKQRHSGMSMQTKNFIQKICYKKAASIDMTRHGFIHDSKLYPVNLLMKPLREQLEKICGKPASKSSSRRTSATQKKVKICLQATAPSTPQAILKPPRSTPHTPSSVLSNPTTCALRYTGRKVSIAPPPSPINTIKKSVRIIVPKYKKKLAE